MTVANARHDGLRYYEHKEEMETEKPRNLDTERVEGLVSRDQATRLKLKIAIVLHHEFMEPCRPTHESRLSM